MIEDRLKQRLTGAAIVVALMVLLVPEMFRGRPPATPATEASAAGGPPLRSYTIDLKDGAARSASGEAATVRDAPALAAPPMAAPAASGAPAVPAAGSPASGPPGAVATVPAGAGTASAPPASAAPAAVAPAVATPSAQAATPARAAPPAQAVPAVAVAPAAAAAAKPAPVASGADGGEGPAGRFQVQLGLFASRANADRLAARAARQGVRVQVSGPDARGLFRVHTMTYRSRADAQAVQQKLRELGLSAALTPQR